MKRKQAIEHQTTVRQMVVLISLCSGHMHQSGTGVQKPCSRSLTKISRGPIVTTFCLGTER